MTKPEIICECEIHPAASIFPLLEGERFQSLVDSIAVHGVQNPIVCFGNVVLDGRNRLRAVDQLRSEGRVVDLPAVQWSTSDGMTSTEWITAQNLDRRHLSEDAYVTAQAALNRILRKEAKERQAAGLKKGTEKPVALKTAPRENKPKTRGEASTAGKVAAKAGVSIHKAKQALKLDKAVEEGVIPEDVQRNVIAGKIKLRDAVKEVSVKPKLAMPAMKAAHKKTRLSADVLDDLRFLLHELLASESVSRQQIVDELTTWIDRANNK